MHAARDSIQGLGRAVLDNYPKKANCVPRVAGNLVIIRIAISLSRKTRVFSSLCQAIGRLNV